MRQSHTGGLLEEEGVLLHPRDRVKIGKPQLTVLQHPAIKARKIVHAKERKELLRLHLDALDDLVRKARWTVECELAGREVFAAIVKNLMGLVVLLDLSVGMIATGSPKRFSSTTTVNSMPRANCSSTTRVSIRRLKSNLTFSMASAGEVAANTPILLPPAAGFTMTRSG